MTFRLFKVLDETPHGKNEIWVAYITMEILLFFLTPHTPQKNFCALSVKIQTIIGSLPILFNQLGTHIMSSSI
jgi:hypothetical protein